MSGKTFSVIKIGSLRKILRDFNDEEYIGVYKPQITLLIFNEDCEHQGSIALKDDLISRSRREKNIKND